MLALACLVAAPACADTLSEVKAHEAFFARACWEGDVPAVMTFYADDAVVIWPGAGAEAKGKAAIERLVTEFCTRRPAPPTLRPSRRSRSTRRTWPRPPTGRTR
jgi:ketosteroid isomerase-like protein